MKNQIGVLALVFVLLTGACKKDETDDGNGSPLSTLDTLSVPTAFKQNILFEVFTGTWCGWCPELDLEVDEDLAANPSRMFAVMIHSSDFLDADEDAVLHDFFDIQGVPTLTFNYNDFGYSNYNSYLNKNPKSGIALGSTVNDDGSVDLKVSVGFDETVDKRLQLGVYLVEDGIIASQQNYYDDDPTSPLYHAGPTIYDFTHNNVFRLSISENPLGDNIAASETTIGNKITKDYHFTLDPSWEKDNLKVVAFITDGVLKETSQGSNLVFNVNGAGLGETALWH